MKTTFGAITQPHIRDALLKKENNSVSIINVLWEKSIKDCL